MSYDAAVEVKDSVQEMLQRDPNIVMVAINNDAGSFGVLVGAIDPDAVDTPKELDGVPIRVVKMNLPSAEEYKVR